MLENICIKSAVTFLALTLNPCLAQTFVSGFAPPEENFGEYVVTSGPGFDTGCSFRSDGPLIIHLAVPSPVN